MVGGALSVLMFLFSVVILGSSFTPIVKLATDRTREFEVTSIVLSSLSQI